MTACMHLVHEGCGAAHITVGGADNDLRNAVSIASDGVHRDNLEPSSRCELGDPRQVRFGIAQACYR